MFIIWAPFYINIFDCFNLEDIMSLASAVARIQFLFCTLQLSRQIVSISACAMSDVLSQLILQPIWSSSLPLIPSCQMIPIGLHHSGDTNQGSRSNFAVFLFWSSKVIQIDMKSYQNIFLLFKNSFEWLIWLKKSFFALKLLFDWVVDFDTLVQF